MGKKVEKEKGDNLRIAFLHLYLADQTVSGLSLYLSLTPTNEAIRQ